jgi:hypothetical protein
MSRVADAPGIGHSKTGFPPALTHAKTCNIVPDLERLAFPVEKLTPLPGNPRQGDVEAVARSSVRGLARGRSPRHRSCLVGRCARGERARVVSMAMAIDRVGLEPPLAIRQNGQEPGCCSGAPAVANRSGVGRRAGRAVGLTMRCTVAPH